MTTATLDITPDIIAKHNITGILIEDAPGLGTEVRVAREDPGAVAPGADRVL